MNKYNEQVVSKKDLERVLNFIKKTKSSESDCSLDRAHAIVVIEDLIEQSSVDQRTIVGTDDFGRICCELRELRSFKERVETYIDEIDDLKQVIKNFLSCN